MADRKQSLEGRVAGVLNERELAINIGARHGVFVGMKFKVLAESPAEIIDPETGDLLGLVDREKVRVQVIELQEKFSICRTYRTRISGDPSLYAMYQTLSRPFGNIPTRVVETLKVEDYTLPPPLPEEESYVKTGDRVVSFLEEDV